MRLLIRHNIMKGLLGEVKGRVVRLGEFGVEGGLVFRGGCWRGGGS